MKRELDARLEAQLHWSCGTLGTEGQGYCATQFPVCRCLRRRGIPEILLAD